MIDNPYWETPEYKAAAKRRLGERQAELLTLFNRGRRPDCRGRHLIGGPSGGLSQNLTCAIVLRAGR